MSDLFVSYSRKDRDFVHRLVDGLAKREKEIWVDWEDIAPIADWMSEIELGIDGADSFAFVISPDSLTSEVCAKELDHARKQGKRIVPLLHREPNGAAVPPELASRNWIFFRAGDDFDGALETCVRALETDLEWLHTHTRLLVRAREWEGGNRERSLLLRGPDMRAAESELASVPADAEPQPTPLQREYVLASRRSQSNRQRTVLGAVTAALLVAVVLALLALWQRSNAISNERTATSRELATAAVGVLDTDPQLGAVLARDAVERKRTAEAEEALRRALSLSNTVATTERDRPLTTAAFSGDGARFLAAGEDGTAFVASSDDGRVTATFRHTGGPVTWAAFGPGDRLVVTSGADGTARIWDAATGTQRNVLRGHRGRVSRAVFSPDGRLVATGGADGTARLWNTESGRQLHVLRQGAPVFRVFFAPDGRSLVTGGDRDARIWDVRTGRLEHTLPPGKGELTALAVDPAGGFVATGSDGGTIGLFDLRTGRLLHSFTAHEGAVAALAFSQDGRFLASGGLDRTAAIWRTSDGQLLRTLPAQDDIVSAVAFGGGDGLLATGTGKGTVRMWNLFGVQLDEFRGHTAWIMSLAFSPDSRRLLTSSKDGTARVWDTTTRAPRALLQGTLTVNQAVFSPDGKLIATDGQPGGLWNATDGRSVRMLRPGGAPVAFSGDGARVALGAFAGDMAVYDVSTGGQLATLHGHTSVVHDVALDADGSLVVTGSDDGTARIWRVPSGESVAVLRAHRKPVDAVAFSPDGELVATAGRDGTTRLWTAAGVPVATMRQPAQVNHVVFSPQGNLLATGGTDDTVRLWTTAGKRVATLRKHSRPILGLAFSADGKTLVSGASDNTARVWSVPDGAPVAELDHPGYVTSVDVSADGRFVVTGSSDGFTRIWETKTGLLVRQLWGSSTPITTVDLSPDGAGIVTTNSTTAPLLYACDLCGSIDDLLGYADEHVHRELTASERAAYLHEKGATP